MPASDQTTVDQIFMAASQNKRDQPWKKALVDSARKEDTADKEIVKTGGPLDILINFFVA